MTLETADDDDDNKSPEFFNVYIHHLTFHRMLIPRDFLCYMGRRNSGIAELTGPSGRTWRVQLDKDDKDFYFTEGWRAFVKDNFVQEGNFMFFKYQCDLTFSVVIYDESMCEKSMEFDDECSQDGGGVVEIGEDENVVPIVTRRNVKHFQQKQEIGEEENGGPIGEVRKPGEQTAISIKPSFQKCILGSSINIPKTFLVENSLSYNNNEKLVLRNSKNSSWEVNIIKCPSKFTLGGGWPAFARENNIKAGDVCKFELLDRLEMMVHVVNEKDGMGLKKVNAETLKSSSLKRAARKTVAARTMPSYVKPSFTVVMKNYSVVKHFIMPIPWWFIRKNSLHYKSSETMILRTKKDSFWPVNLIRDLNNHRLSAGWAAFVHSNNIKTGDTCKFELVNRLEMKVHIKATSDRKNPC